MKSARRRSRDYHPAAELARVALLAALAFALARPLLTALFVGGTDARWYATMLREFLSQERAGRFPVLVGQGWWDWMGGVHPFRSAPMFCYVAGLWDVLTLRSLGVFALQHLAALTAVLAGALGFYAAAVAIVPRRRWEAMLLAALYAAAPAWPAILYRAEDYMTLMALGALPLVLYGNARSLLSADGRGWPQLAAGLALAWMCHPPVALLASLTTVLLQGGALLFGGGAGRRGRAALGCALLFAGFGAFYFASMSELPPPGGSLRHDAVQVAGFALALAGLARGVLRREGWRWAGCWLAGALLLAFSSLPWLVWMAIAAAAVEATAFLARRLWGFDPSRRAAEIVLPCLLLSAGAAGALLGPLAAGADSSCLAGLRANAAHAADFFLPVSAAHHGSDYQPGIGLWAVLLLLGAAFFRTRSAACKLFFAAGFLPVLGLVRVPWISEFLAGTLPPSLAGIASFPLVLRLVPVLTAFLAMGGVLWLAEEGPGPFGRAGPLALLGAGAAAACLQARVLVKVGEAAVATVQASKDVFRPENVRTPHFDYDLLPMPSYFWEGAVDPRLEFRLRDGGKRVVFGPDDCARRMESAGARAVRLVAHHASGEGPEWLELSPAIDLAPGEHLLLRFEFDPSRNDTGWLIFQGRHGYREYHLPLAGLSRGFGVGPACSHVVSLWNSGSSPERYRLRMTREAGNDVKDRSTFATVIVSRYDDARNPVRVRSLDPLRLDVDAPQGGWLETTRVFLPGYRARLDGRPVPVVRSPERLAMIAIPAGRHTLELRYRMTAKLWLAGAVSLLTWGGWLAGLLRRRTRPFDEESLADGPVRGESSGPGRADSVFPAPGGRSDAHAVRRLREWLYRGAFIAAVASVLAFYGWTVATSGGSFRRADAANQYYPALARGFQKGHLYMDLPVNPALLALPEDKRPGNAPYLLDASLYHRHYYLYFGVTPAAVLFWPYLALTGRLLPEPAAALAFAILGFGFATVWWLGIRRRLFPGLGGRWVVLGVVAIGLCSAAPSALRRPMFYEVAILSGYAFTMMALWAATEARFRPGRRNRWLAASGLAAGLAFGSRANLAPAELVLLAAGSAGAARAAAAGLRGRAFRSGLAAAAMGFGVVCAGLGAYNFARFGNPLEFGHRHQLGVNPRHMFHAANIGYNFDLYYLKPPALNGYFPFVAPALPPPQPPDYIGREHVHGEWVWLPLALLGLAAAAARLLKAGRGAAGSERPKASAHWLWVAVLPLVLFGLNVLIVSAAGSRANRYMLDFHPALVLVTLLALAPALAGRGPWPSLARFLTVAGVGVAAVFNVLGSIEAQGFYALVRPADYRRLSNAVDRLAWPWLREEADLVGDREVRVRWPASESGIGAELQPFLAGGTAGFDDVLWVDYDGGGRARFAYRHGEYGTAVGPWFPLPLGRVSTVRIGGGFLLPGVGHPWYGGRPTGEQEILKRRLRVSVDGRVRFDRDVPSYDSSPRLQQWGSWRSAGAARRLRFGGELGRPAVEPVDDAEARELLAASGAIRLKLLLPMDRFGSAEPLFQSGSVGAFDTLAVDYVDRRTVRLVHDGFGKGEVVSDPIPVDYGRLQQVEIEAPSAADGVLWPESGGDPVPSRTPPGRLAVRWNGRDVFQSSLPMYPAGAASIAVGGSMLRSSGARLMYSGPLVESPRREPLGRIGPGALEFRPAEGDTLADERGVLVWFVRADGESAGLVWRRTAAGARLGWVDAGGTVWSAVLPGGGAAPDLRLSISPPQSNPDVALAADVAREEGIEVRLGAAAILSASSDLFSGPAVEASAILPSCWSGSALSGSVAGTQPASAVPPELPGRILIRFRLPTPFAGAQPVLEMGRPLHADSVYLRCAPDGRCVLGLDHWGVGSWESAPLALSAAAPHGLVVELGSLFAGTSVPRDRVRLTLDGRVVLDARIGLYPVKPGEVWVGRNPLGMSTSGPLFRGRILSIRTRQPPLRR